LIPGVVFVAKVVDFLDSIEIKNNDNNEMNGEASFLSI
jgi:hypothetical protein